MTAAFPVPPKLAGHPFFQYRNNVLYAKDVPLDHLAERLGTPLYVYSRAAPKALLDHVFQRLQARGQDHLQLVLEPGRSLVGNAGVLLTTVQYLKHGEARNFAIVDAAMNDLLRGESTLP